MPIGIKRALALLNLACFTIAGSSAPYLSARTSPAFPSPAKRKTIAEVKKKALEALNRPAVCVRLRDGSAQEGKIIQVRDEFLILRGVVPGAAMKSRILEFDSIAGIEYQKDKISPKHRWESVGGVAIGAVTFYPWAFISDRVSQRRLRWTKKIVGEWQLITPSPGDLVERLEFHSNGAVTHTTGIMFNRRYRVEGRQLHEWAADPKTGKTSGRRAEVRFEVETLMPKDTGCYYEVDTLVLKYAGEERELRMTGRYNMRPGDPAIVGEWCHPRPDYGNRIACMQFARDGGMRYRLPAGSKTGRYTVAREALVFNWENSPAVTSQYRVENDRLIVRTGDREGHYQRTGWTDRHWMH